MADTGPAKLPGLPAVAVQGNPALSRWMSAVNEHLEVRAGSRGNPAERVVTQRELAKLSSTITYLTQDKAAADSTVVLPLGGGLSASVAIEAFAEAIRSTRLYRDLMRRLDDPDRFDDLPQLVREALLASLSEEAAQRGAEVSRVEKLVQSKHSSLSLVVETLTAAVEQAAAGVREVSFASAETNRAQAGKIVQLEASLGKYYQDGTPGRALLEQQMTVTADRIEGLRAQYTLKVQAGGALAGYGIAAEEVNGRPSSAFIISADKFAIVSPSYSGGLTTTPDLQHIPFGVDANGIYLNNNVYIKGNIRIDAGGRRLIDGLRGSLQLAASGYGWSDTIARQAVWAALGNGGVPTTNNHLVIGDQVTISSGNYAETRSWMGSYWDSPGQILNGSLLVNGTVAAQKVDTRGLDIRDAFGNVIFSAGTKLDMSRIQGLGGLASQNAVAIGQTVKMPDGTTLSVGDFVNRLSRINSSTISTFMEAAAIGSAYIGNAAVGTLQIQGNSVIVPASGTSGGGGLPSCAVYLPIAGTVFVIVTMSIYETSPSDGGAVLASYSMQIESSNSGPAGFVWNHTARARYTVCATAARFNCPAGWNYFQASLASGAGGTVTPASGSIVAIGTLR